nr:MAG TPA_asm: hypothetical protein [Bacteriophage sp.]
MFIIRFICLFVKPELISALYIDVESKGARL